MNCLIYARVSTEQQAERELSIPAQLRAAREHAAKLGWTVHGEFVEPGVSGRTSHRPVLQQMLACCRQKDPKIDVVLVHKLDRFARSVYDHATIKLFLKQHGVTLASVVENVDDSISGQLVENIMASIAEFYSANLAEEVKKGMRMMVERGGWPHKPTRGYQLVRDDAGRRSVEIDPTVAPAIREAFDSYSTGFCSLHDIREQLAGRGILTRVGKPLPIATVREMLSNPFYAGRVRWNEVERPGNHEAIIPESLFLRVQDTLHRRYKDPGERGKLHFLLRGIAVCAECGSRLTAERHDRWSYYRCIKNSLDKRLCGAKFSNAAVSEKHVETICESLRLGSAFRERLEAAALQQIEGQRANLRRSLESLRMRRAKLDGQEVRLTESFAAGETSPKAYRAVLASVRSKIVELNTLIAAASASPESSMEKLKQVLDFAASVRGLYRHMDQQGRKRLLRLLFARIILEQGQVVGYALNSPFDTLLSTADPPVAPSARSDLEQPKVPRSKRTILEVGPKRTDLGSEDIKRSIEAVLAYDVTAISTWLSSNHSKSAA